MSVNSVLPGLLPSYGPLSGNNSQAAKSGRVATALPPATSIEADGPRRAFATAEEAASGNSSRDSNFQSPLEEALRAGATGARSTGGAAESGGGQTSAAIALYKRVSQIGNDESTPSALLQRWNSIVQSERTGDADAPASPPHAFSQHGATRFDSGILDLTA